MLITLHVHFKGSFCAISSDVLSELFEIGKKWQLERLADEGNQDEVPFELLVSQICSHTRRVALSTPRIWTWIDIHPSTVCERIMAYIARSASAWLDIRINMTQNLSPADEKALVVVLDIICPQAHRWRRLSVFRLFERKENAVVRRICKCNSPGLQYLSLVVEDIDNGNINALVSHVRTPTGVFRSTAHLRFVRLGGLTLHFFRPRMDSVVILHLDETKHIPWKYNNFRETLLNAPSLLHLSIYGDIVAPRSWPQRQNDITMPFLLSLRICGVSGEVYSNILLIIDAPVLESLILKRLQEHDLDALGELVDVTRFINLRNLTFWDFDVSVYTYERIMQVFQNITSFSTFHSTLPNSRLVELLLDKSEIKRGHELPPWPTLKTLSFPLNSDDNEMDLAQALINSRKTNGCPVPTILLCASADEEVVVESEVQGVKEVYSSRLAIWPPDFMSHVQDDIFLH